MIINATTPTMTPTITPTLDDFFLVAPTDTLEVPFREVVEPVATKQDVPLRA
jgi:hypothetical protein